MPKDNENFQIILGGANHEIDVNTLILTLTHLNTIVEEANKELSKGGKSIDLKVKATEKGSFVVDLAVHAIDIVDSVKTLFSEGNVGYLSNLTGTIGGIYCLGKFLQGKLVKDVKDDPKRKKSIEITNYEGDIQVFKTEVVNIYLENPKVTAAVAHTMKALDADQAVDSFNFESKPQTTNIDRELFNAMARDEKLNTRNSHKVELPNKRITIVSPDFEFNRRWTCYFEGEKRLFSIDTDQLKDAVGSGLKFGIGDSMIVDLQVLKEWSKQFDTYVNKSYSIVAFHKYVAKEEQSKMDL